jgi:hypothetical protein
MDGRIGQTPVARRNPQKQLHHRRIPHPYLQKIPAEKIAKTINPAALLLTVKRRNLGLAMSLPHAREAKETRGGLWHS